MAQNQVVSEAFMKKSIFLLGAFTTMAMLLAALVVMRYGVSMTVAFGSVFIMSMLLSATLIWRNRKNKAHGHKDSDKSGRLKWLIVPFAAGAIGAPILASQQAWNVGDTVGAILFGVFALLIGYELLRRRRATHSR
jgi:uncharacterized membrane protein YfcA